MEGQASNRKRISKGRQKIPMRKITNKNSLYATFSKRRDGVFKKASELSLECKVNVGIIISSPTDKPHSFMAPTPGTVANYSKIHINQDEAALFLDACKKSQIEPFCKNVEQLADRKQAAVECGLQLMADANTLIGQDSCWMKPIKDLGYEEAKQMKAWPTYVLLHMKNHAIYMVNLNFHSGF